MTTPESSSAGRPKRRRRFWLLMAAVIVVVAAVTAAVTGLLMNIFEHKQEALNPFYRVVELTNETEDPAVWGKNFPIQYDDYKRTVDQTRTRYGGRSEEHTSELQSRLHLVCRLLLEKKKKKKKQ